MYPYWLSNVNQVSGSPESPNWLENQICYLPPFYPEIFNVAAKVEAFVYPIWNGCMNLTLPIFFLCFEKSKNLVVRKILQQCFAMKLQKYLVDYKAWGVAKDFSFVSLG